MKKSTPKKILTPKALARKVLADIPKHTDLELKRYIGAVSENFGHQISAVAEQFSELNNKIDSLIEEVGGIKLQLTSLETKVDALERRMDAFERRMGALEKDVATIKEDMTIIKSDMRLMKGNLTHKVDYADFAALEKRVERMEAKLHR